MTIYQLLKKTKNTLAKHGVKGVFSKVGMYTYRFVRKFSFKTYTIQRSIQGEQIQFVIADVIGEEWYTQLHDEVPELRWLKEQVKPGDTVIDCGAHHGLITVLFGKWAGDKGKVISFEALPANAAVVKSNVSLNGLTNVIVRNEAVGKEMGTIFFTLDSNASVAPTKQSKTIQVPMVNLDTVLLERPHLLKIDVEGYEIEVLKGAEALLKGRPALAVEIHCILFDQPLAKVEQVLALLTLDSYQAWIQTGYYDELITYDPQVHTPEFIVQFDKVNVYAIPRD